MIPRACRAAPALLALAGIVWLGGCSVDKEEFHHRLYSCNPNAANPACGTDLNQQPMACVPAYQLGGRNFCASGCDAITEPAEGEATICLSSGPKTPGAVTGARLPRCNPTVSGSCNHDELTCLRTDLIVDEGVCMTVNACENDRDCRDPVRSKCMGELVRETYGAKSELKAQNTYCLQSGCKVSGTSCSPGEVCLRNVIPRSSYPPDICVPNCDANNNCPPNYFCYKELYSKASPAVCLPGLIGLRCRTRLDCLFGDCVDTDAHFKVCSVACKSDADCAKFDSIQGTFFCNDKGYCAGARAFRGSQCYTQDDCLFEGEICAKITNTNPYGQCLQQCPLGTCPSYGGVPHPCRPQVNPDNTLALNEKPWVCWPGYLNQLCGTDAQCLPGLACRPLNAMNPGGPARVCSVSCQTDADCEANRFTADGWCDVANGLCLSPKADGATCERSAQCESKSCTTDKKCAPLAGF
jgi:hypothetical protein